MDRAESSEAFRASSTIRSGPCESIDGTCGSAAPFIGRRYSRPRPETAAHPGSCRRDFSRGAASVSALEDRARRGRLGQRHHLALQRPTAPHRDAAPFSRNDWDATFINGSGAPQNLSRPRTAPAPAAPDIGGRSPNARWREGALPTAAVPDGGRGDRESVRLDKGQRQLPSFPIHNPASPPMPLNNTDV
jgi:hypothetical protein